MYQLNEIETVANQQLREIEAMLGQQMISKARSQEMIANVEEWFLNKCIQILRQGVGAIGN